MKLLIVESPSKTLTIKQYLGKDFEVVASKGHIRDIKNQGKDNLGLDFSNNLKPLYEIIPTQYATVKLLKEKAEEASIIYLATDPDREGEAISWHLKEALNTNNKEVKRIEFNEITRSAVLNAIDNPREIDLELVSSQETRKIIDRIIGYKLSSFVKDRVGAKSAGRVQSVVLKMIVEREEKVTSFIPERFYEIEAVLEDGTILKLQNKENNKVLQIKTEEEAKRILSELGDTFTVSNVVTSKKSEKPSPAFKTSSMQTTAASRLSFPISKVSKLAQQLYEGINHNDEHIAFVTYIRTDVTRLSDEFKAKLTNHIKKEYGVEYLGYAHEDKVKNTDQGAHEAIRPVDLSMTPDKAKEYLTKDQLSLYSLIYERAIESMMSDAEILVTTTLFDNNGYTFKTTSEKTIFEGFKKASIKKTKEKAIVDYEIGKGYKQAKTEFKAKDTEGPKRYNEGSLVKEMETSGIGRPSTYSPTISTLKNSNYITIERGSKEIKPTEEGKLVSRILNDYFNMIINVNYTASMESDLDEIAQGTKKEENIVNSFYSNFDSIYSNAKMEFKPIETGNPCPLCGSPLVFKSGRNGKFIACSNYPKCRHTENIKVEKANIPLIECPKCHIGHLVERKSKGKTFYACSTYPSCDFTISSLSRVKKIK